jgi:hypothetical protein
MVSFAFSSLLLLTIFIAYKSLSRDSWLKHKLNFTYKIMSVGQISGLFAGFVMTLNVLVHFLYSASSGDKLNNIINVVAVGLSVIFTFMILSFKKTALLKPTNFVSKQEDE